MTEPRAQVLGLAVPLPGAPTEPVLERAPAPHPDARRVALVTGAATGLGEGIVRRLAADGWAIALVDVRPDVGDTADRIAHELGVPGGRFLPLVADVSDERAVDDAVRRATEALGRLDLAVANAGIGGPSDDVVELDAREWDRVMAVNLRGTFLTARAAARVMVPAGRGVIVTLASIFGKDPVPGGAAYCASKAAVEALTRSLALELAPHGVRVNAISPGNMATEMHWDELRHRAVHSGRTFEEELEAARRDVPLGRHGTGADIGAAVAWLASDDASYVTGHTLSVNGGIQRT